MQKIRRCVLGAVLLAVGGAVVNIAVAAGIVLWSGEPSVKFQQGGRMVPGRSLDDRWTVREENMPGRSRIVKTNYRTEYVLVVGRCPITERRESLASAETKLSAGFPFKAFEAAWTVSEDASGRKAIVSNGRVAETPATPFLLQIPAREFPVSPSWPGLAANAGVYAVLLGLLWRISLIRNRGGRLGQEEVRA